MRSFTLLALVGGAAASPAVNFNAAFCSAVTNVISAAKQQATATSFCSSYLSIPLKTTTVTSTTYTSTYTGVSTKTTTTQVVIAPVVTDMAIASTTSFTTTTFTDTSTTTTDTTSVLATSTVSSCSDPLNPPSKLKQRALAPIVKPTALTSYALGAPVSSACSCLSIAPSTTTVTSVTSLVKTVSTTTSVGTTTTTTPHTTSTSISTLISAISTTTTTWTSVQATTTTGTTTIVSLPTFKIEVVGGWNQGSYAQVQSYGSSLGVALSGGASSSASTFYLSGTNLVIADGANAGDIAEEDPTKYSGDTELVMFDDVADVAANANADVLQCSIAYEAADGSCPLTCAVQGGTLNFDCGTWWRIQQPGLDQYCSNTFRTFAL
ncbi:hypothetical protein M409DRAFT_58106 [Zasmidium cellare ATCC 36951]|uniref:Uncharacterized protein n=1 Tax=Zasmidium cellare ATCC 36951 TaxID=1080233 RepID=A0A6A6CB60_ZASCE|nr:uncharacterized protein M409DRAFT_58106 [Zasmidium cellare ATCC 36951]KAF2162696.1 hypothetical protein M409DRAFT_58106 [Zasmidium cellare ATCC 36951]